MKPELRGHFEGGQEVRGQRTSHGEQVCAALVHVSSACSLVCPVLFPSSGRALISQLFPASPREVAPRHCGLDLELTTSFHTHLPVFQHRFLPEFCFEPGGW